jgi:RHS repeat-associated protein
VQEDHYYPFGLQLSGQSYTNTALLNKYLFNGKEKQDQTGMYDYGFRQLDPVLGRWFCVDRMAERYLSSSPYAYCENNPVNKIDVLGLWGEDDGYGDEYDERDMEYHEKSNTESIEGADPLNPQNGDFDYQLGDHSENHLLEDFESLFSSDYGTFNESDRDFGDGNDFGNDNENDNDRHDDPNSYYMFPTIPSAEEFIHRNNEKEMFYYITEDNQVIIGPWSDATETGTSPRYHERFNPAKKEVLYGGENYDVKYFGHTHPDWSHSAPSGEDRAIANFFNYYDVETLIYFQDNFYIYFDDGKKEEPFNPFF